MTNRYMNLIPRQDSEFEDEFEPFLLKEGELRIIANRNN